MAAFITGLTGESGITASSLWGAVAPIAPFVVVMVLFALGYYIIRKSVKGAAKGKVRM